MFWPPQPLSFGSAYVYDDFDVEGDMLAFPHLCDYLIRHVQAMPLAQRLRLAWRIWRLRTAPGRSSATGCSRNAYNWMAAMRA